MELIKYIKSLKSPTTNILNEKKVLEVLSKFISGENLVNSCQLIGVTTSQFYLSLKNSPGLEDIFNEAKLIHDDVLREKLHQVVEDDALSDSPLANRVKSAQWLLERMFNKYYGTRQTVAAQDKMDIRDAIDVEFYKNDNNNGLPKTVSGHPNAQIHPAGDACPLP